MPPFGAFPPFGLSTPNFSPMNSFASSTTTGFHPPPSAPSLLSNDPTNSTATDVWSNGLSNTNMNIDYNEYVKQLGLFMNAFSEQPQKLETDKSKSKRFIFNINYHYQIKRVFFSLSRFTNDKIFKIKTNKFY